MTGGLVGNRRRNRRSWPEPTPFWGADVGQGAEKASSRSCRPCSSCGGLSSFCRNCQQEVPGTLTPRRDYLQQNCRVLGIEALQQGDELESAISGKIDMVPRALVRVPPEARPGDKLLLTRTHHLDPNGGYETTDWECNVANDETLARAPPAPGIQPSPIPPDVSQLMIARPGTIDSFVDLEASTAASLVDLKDQAQQQMMEWNQKLQKQVEVLEQEKLKLQELYTNSKESNQRLEAELQKSRHRCTELECLARQGVAQTANAKSAHDENQELRKQLAAYSIEIDVLREDLRVANMPAEEMAKEAEAIDHEMKLMELRKEYDEEKCRFEADQKRREEEHQELDERYKLLDRGHAELGERYNLLDVGHRQLEEGHRKVVESERAKDEVISNQSALIRELKDCLILYKENAEILQEEFVDQTRVLQNLTKRVQSTCNEINGVMDDGHKDMAGRLTMTGLSAFGVLSHLTARADRWKVNRALAKVCFSHWFEYHQRYLILSMDSSRPYLRYDIAWEMACARQGFVLTKVRHDTHKLEERLVFLDAELGILRWGDAKHTRKHATLKTRELTTADEDKLEQKYPSAKGLGDLLKKRAQKHKMYNGFHKDCVDCGSLSKQTRGLDLRDVTHIDYGVSNRASMVAKERPWKCFSLCTMQRSFDFVCPEEEVARCFVLAVSRVIYCIKGGTTERVSLSGSFPPAAKVQYCERNHPIPHGAIECVWKCGAAKQQVVCMKGHKMIPGQVSCTTCGSFRKKATAKRQGMNASQICRGATSNWQPTYLPEWTHYVRGGVQTRGQYVAMQAWCKLTYYAMLNDTSVPKLFLQALMRSVLQKGEVIDTGSKRKENHIPPVQRLQRREASEGSEQPPLAPPSYPPDIN